MKKILALMMIGAFLLAVLPSAIAYYPYPKPEKPEFAKKINGEWTDIDNPVEFIGLHACETIEVEIMALFFEDLYAYDFVVTWPVAWLTLVDHEIKHIHTADFPIAEEFNLTEGWYHQAVTATSPAEGWGDGMTMAPIANLFFHLDNDKQWPGNVTLTICFEESTKAYDSCTTEIDHDRQGGYIKLVPLQPTIKMLPPVVYKSVVPETFEVQFEIQNVVKMKSFHFEVTWDPTQLKTDAQNVWIKDFLPPPYEYTYIFVGDGILYISVQLPCEKPLRNGTGELFGIRFTTLVPDAWDDGIPPYAFAEDDHPIWYPIPCHNYINIGGYIDKDNGQVYQELGDPDGVTVKGPDIKFDVDGNFVLGGFDGKNTTKFAYDKLCDMGDQYTGYIVGYYELRPVPGDLDLDGHCDVIDLSAMAKVYGDADTGFDLDGSGFVDLVDIVIVAKNICRTEPDALYPWPIFDP